MNHCSQWLWLSLSLGALAPLAAADFASGSESGPEIVDSGGGGRSSVAATDMETLVALLDSPRFGARAEATERLAAKGSDVIPHLVELLDDRSAEVRFRVTMLLLHHHAFEEVAPALLAALDQPHGTRARMILRERALEQIEAVCRLPHAERLFKFWGTNLDRYCLQARTRLDEADTTEQIVGAVEPLLQLRAKSRQFDSAIARLEALSLPYDHQYSPGFIIADTLARGLDVGHLAWIQFAEEYLVALETLAVNLRLQTDSNYAVRRELLDRANMSQGAAGYLVQLLAETSPLRTLLSERVGITPEFLQFSFCAGLASTEPQACDRGVGRVHVVDMLTESLRKWPDAPREGVVQRLITAVIEAAREGEKPKALALLDALEACRDLSNHGLRVDAGLGQQLGERLFVAAMAAPNNRAYHPTQSVHGKFIALMDMGITPQHAAFPSQLLADYLGCAEHVTTDGQRLALERYLRILERLKQAGIEVVAPDVPRFICAMRDGVSTRHELLAAGVSRIDPVLRAHSGSADQSGVFPALDALTDELLGGS